MTDDIDNDGTTLHESGGVVQPTDAQIDALWSEAVRRNGTTAGTIRDVVRAVLAASVASRKLLTPEKVLEWLDAEDIEITDKQFARLAAAVASHEPVPVVASRVTLDFKQATELLEMFGGEPTEITLMTGQGHSGEGLYAVYNADPEGAVYLGATDEDATPQAEPAVAEQAKDGWHDEKLPPHGPLPFAFVGLSEHAREAAREYAEIYARAALTSQSTPPPESEPDFDECECGYGCPPGCGCRHSGEGTTPPPESAGPSDAGIEPLQGAANWLVKALGRCGAIEIGWRLSIGHNRASRLYEAAILAANPTALPDGGSKA